MALVAALALHAGFQLTVTLVVYPALAAVRPADWRAAHAAHSRRITPLVVVVYAAALAACAWSVARPDDRSGPADAWLAVAVTGTVVAVGLTATQAGPLHGRLGEHDPAMIRRLLVVDRLRCAAAVVAAAAALMAVA